MTLTSVHSGLDPSVWKLGRDYQIIDVPNQDAILFFAGNHQQFRVSSELAQRLKAGLDQLSEREWAEWESLEKRGLISDRNRTLLADASFRDGANLAINVNLTAFCNLGCTYCFADGGDYGRIKGKLELNTVDHIFQFIDEHLLPNQSVRFEFFGGEPLLNFDIIKEICERSDTLLEQKGIRFIYRISTNLTVMPEGVLDLFASRNFIVSVSIDGGKETHDRNRPTKGGTGSFDKIIRNCHLVRRASDAITLVARMTVVSTHPSLIDNVKELWNHNIFDYFQIYPGVVPVEKSQIFHVGDLPKDESEPATTVLPGFRKEFETFVSHYADFFTPDNRFRGVLEYERIVDMVYQGKMAVSFCSAARNYYTFSPDDSIMPCHRMVGETQFQVGKGDTGIDQNLNAWRVSVDENPTCSQCWIRYICGGGCKQENYVATGDINEPNPEMCDAQINMVTQVLKAAATRETTYQEQNRAPLDNLFVSCGRPIILNMRPETEPQKFDFSYFHPF